jgi:hypothetical protein
MEFSGKWSTKVDNQCLSELKDQPKNIVELAMHKMIIQLSNIPDEIRADSERWLEEFHRNSLWEEVKKAYPDQWVIIEATEAYSEGDRRTIDQITVVDNCQNDNRAVLQYLQLHRQHREKELNVVHTSRPVLDIIELPPAIRA